VEQELVSVCGSNIFLSYSTCKTISANVPNLDNLITLCKVLKNFVEYQLRDGICSFIKTILDTTNILKLDFTGRSTLPRKEFLEVPWSPNEHDWEPHHSTPVE
jgi:hypothetical protein